MFLGNYNTFGLTNDISIDLSPLNLISWCGVQHLWNIFFFTIRGNVRIGTKNTILIYNATPQFLAASDNISELKVRLHHLLLTLVGVKYKNRYLE